MQLHEEFETYLLDNLPSIETFHPHYEEALRYMLRAGGKRFRPMLLLGVVKAKNPLLVPSAMRVALAVEMLHTYSLIHDDLPVMDDADLRRGNATLHKKFNELTAVLVGDALNTHAFYLIATAALHNDIKNALARELAYNGGIYGMVHGQILDCYFENRKLPLERLRILHINKTAKLIAASLKMGAIIAVMNESEQEALYDFGIKLGLLFQIQDDIIDATKSSEEAGKTTQNDEEKNSFVNLLGLEGAIAEADKLAEEVEQMLDSMDSDVAKELRALLANYITRHKE